MEGCAWMVESGRGEGGGGRGVLKIKGCMGGTT